MLVLTRKENQSIVIDGNVTVTILEVRGDQIRIGIKAPRDVTVHREEIHLQILSENQASAETSGSDTAYLPTNVGPKPRPGS